MTWAERASALVLEAVEGRVCAKLVGLTTETLRACGAPLEPGCSGYCRRHRHGV